MRTCAEADAVTADALSNGVSDAAGHRLGQLPPVRPAFPPLFPVGLELLSGPLSLPGPPPKPNRSSLLRRRRASARTTPTGWALRSQPPRRWRTTAPTRKRKRRSPQLPRVVALWTPRAPSGRPIRPRTCPSAPGASTVSQDGATTLLTGAPPPTRRSQRCPKSIWTTPSCGETRRRRFQPSSSPNTASQGRSAPGGSPAKASAQWPRAPWRRRASAISASPEDSQSPSSATTRTPFSH